MFVFLLVMGFFGGGGGLLKWGSQLELDSVHEPGWSPATEICLSVAPVLK